MTAAMNSNRYIWTLFLGVTALASCQKDNLENGQSGTSDKGTLAMEDVVVGIDNMTKANVSGRTISLGEQMFVTEKGNSVCLEAFIEDMPAVAGQQTAATKGSAIGMTGFKAKYGQFAVNVYKDGAIFHSTGKYTDKNGAQKNVDKNMEGSKVKFASDTWAFDDVYLWPAGASDSLKNLAFCSYAPVDSFKTSGYTCAGNLTWNNTDSTFSFDYKSPAHDFTAKDDAQRQADILMGVDVQNVEKHKGSVYINMKHALVGVRFIKGDILGTIEAMSLNNFYTTGTAKYHAAGARKDSIRWTGQANKGMFTQRFDFNTVTYATDGTPLDQTSDSSKTFLVIPQKLDTVTKATQPEIIIHMAGALHPDVLKFSEIIRAFPALEDWSTYAGKIITFKIKSSKANNVSVTVSDLVDGLTKKNIVIANDGKSDIYIRACLVGNWLNKDGQVLASWSENGDTCGTFTPAGFPAALPAGWKKAPDGFYYYTKYIPSMTTLSTTTPTKVKTNLFDTYTVSKKPHDATGTWATGGASMTITKFELVIQVQAVQVGADAATAKDYAKAAWGTPSGMETWLDANLTTTQD